MHRYGVAPEADHAAAIRWCLEFVDGLWGFLQVDPFTPVARLWLDWREPMLLVGFADARDAAIFIVAYPARPVAAAPKPLSF